VGSPYALIPLLFLWCLCVVVAAGADFVVVPGGVPAASANAPAKNKQRIGTACFKAGFPMYFHIGHKIPHFSR
jgi:hypothetical protein